MLRTHTSIGYSFDRANFGGISLDGLTEKNVQLAFQFRLPCRLRFPGVVRFPIATVQDSYIAFVNPVKMPGENLMRDVLASNKDEKDLYTTALVINPRPKIAASFVAALRDQEYPDDQGDDGWSLLEASFTAINRAVAAHCKFAEIDFGEASHPIVDSSALRLKIWICAPEAHQLSDDDIEHLASLNRYLIGQVGIHSPTIDVGDLTPQTMAKIERVYARQDTYVFDEFEYESKHFRERGDSVIALLMAIIALESSHGAFARLYLERNNVDNETADRYLRDQGFYSTLPVSIRLFVSETNRPTDDVLKTCLEAVTIRNSVMHAVLSKGKPKIHKLTKQQVDSAAASVLAVHKCLVAEIERLLNDGGVQQE